MDIKQLQESFSGELENTPKILETFSRDASIFEARPKLIAFPKNAEDIKLLVDFATHATQNGHHTYLTASAGRTDMTGGAICDSIIVDCLRHLNKIGEVTQTNTIQAEPGVYFRDFEKVTLAKDLILPSYPASKSICCLGGMVANNSGGELSFSYGQTINFVKEMEVVLADGENYTLKPWNETELKEVMGQTNFLGRAVKELFALIKTHQDLIKRSKPTTSKNSAGYYLWEIWDGKTFDLTKLFVGSQGTLGIITDCQFKLVKIKSKKELLVVFLKDLEKIGEIIAELKKHQPLAMELFDDHTLKLAIKFAPDIAKKIGKNSIKLLWQFLPEIWMAIKGGLPKIALLVEFAENSEMEAQNKAKQAQKNIEELFQVKTRITKTAEEAEKFWTVRRESFNLLRQHAKGKISAPFVEDIIVHPDELPSFLPKLRNIFARYPSFEYTIAGHAGDANFHIIPFVDIKSATERQMVERLSEEVYALVKEFKGSITAEHNDGLVHGAYLSMMYSPEILEVFRQTKKIFDPLNIFNPYKKVQANMKYFEKYLRKS